MDYSLEVRERFRSPAGAGEFAEGTPQVVAGEAEDRTLNVWFRFQISVAGTVIRAAKFRVFGCPHSIAAAAWVASELGGRDIAAIQDLDVHELRRKLDAPVEKLGKLLVLEDALRECWNALNDLTGTRNGS
jgi:NifU-like protein involved in Fe-S cluster formation